MKHTCGGNVDIISITKKTDNSVSVMLVCNGCGEIEESIRYLYDDGKRDDEIDKLSKLVDDFILTLNMRG